MIDIHLACISHNMNGNYLELYGYATKKITLFLFSILPFHVFLIYGSVLWFYSIGFLLLTVISVQCSGSNVVYVVPQFSRKNYHIWIVKMRHV